MRSLFVLAASLVLATLVPAAAATPTTAPALAPCRMAGVRDRVLCGRLDLPESAASGRTIPIRYAVVRARVRNRIPIFVVPGGPGQSAIDFLPQYAKYFGEYARVIPNHDLVFVDQRGTGRSRPLQCPRLFASHAHAFAELFPSAELRACRARLAAVADLDAYGTDQSTDDLDAVRAALGYARIEIEAGSYGTQFAQVYLRRHPGRAQAVLLEAVAPTSIKLPLPFSRGAQHALDELIAGCAAAVPCHRAFPRFGAEFARVAARFARGPQRVRFTDLDGKRKTLLLAPEVFADRLRQLLYDPDSAAAVPAMIHAAARGNDGPLAQLIALTIDEFGGGVAFGENFSVTCAEDVAFITPAEQAAVARIGFLRDLRLRAQQRACAIWNVRPAPASFLEPVRSDAPVLMISGANDPATPPALGASLLPYLTNARQIVVPNGGHNNGGPCLTRLRVAFLDERRPRALDARCAAAQTRPPFVIRFAPWLAKLRAG